MAERYLDNSGVSRLLQGVNTFVNNAYKNVFTKMIEVDSYETVDLQPNQISKITPAVDGPMTINFIAHTKPNAEYELIADVTPNATITYNGNILWETGEFVPNNFNTIRLKFTTFDSGNVYLAEYTLYSLEDRLLYYSTTDGNPIRMTDASYIYSTTPIKEIAGSSYYALLSKVPTAALTHVFSQQTTLKKVIIPNSITSFWSGTFMESTSLREVYCKPTTPPTGSDMMFKYTIQQGMYGTISCKIYVPSASVDAYKAASGWSTYADAIVGYDFENNTVVE